MIRVPKDEGEMRVAHASKIDVVGTGFVVLDRIYENNEKAFEALGGSCANVLWSLAMLELSVAPVLRLGSDEIGRELCEQFAIAGANTTYIARRENLFSPILVQQTDTLMGTHHFSFTCPETHTEFPRYQPIDQNDLSAAVDAIGNCSVFYSDRVSDAIVRAMETAADAQGIVYFEPSAIGDRDLFDRAIRASSIVKFSGDRLGAELLPTLRELNIVGIMTHGAKGLEVRQADNAVWCDAISIVQVKDSSGSGDMVSVGLIDHLISLKQSRFTLDIEVVLDGVRAGQRLAAANCEYLGARGLFQHQSPGLVRKILDGVAA